MCGFSAATVGVLREIGVPFKAVDVLAEPEKREGIKSFSNWPTIPQIYVGGKFIGGCDIVREMHARGELAPLLRAAVGG
jgi:monothiol glutaredoxin